MCDAHIDDDGRIIVGETVVVNRKQHSPDDAIEIGRHCQNGQLQHIRTADEPGDCWGNPHHIRTAEDVDEETARRRSVACFEDDLKAKLKQDGKAGERWRTAVAQLQGETLVCWCAPQDCHGRVLAQWAERLATW